MSGIDLETMQIEQFLYKEAKLLDEWKLDEWLELIADNASYLIPANDRPEGDPNKTLFLIADDAVRIRARVKRLKSKHAHAENPRSNTRRLISNVMIIDRTDQLVKVTANFAVFRLRREAPDRTYVGKYLYTLQAFESGYKIVERKAVLDSEELGELRNISFIL